jgi:endonuclease YncB( thermonuclease family)
MTLIILAMLALGLTGGVAWAIGKVGLWLLGENENESEKAVVTKVIDGDSLVVETESGTHMEVRLRGVDAPELGQVGGLGARELMEALVEGEEVTVTVPASRMKDKYNRTLVDITHQDESLAEEMVERGAAWAAGDAGKELRDEEAHAREAGKGIWKEGDPTPPWTFRKEHEGKPVRIPRGGPTLDDFR